MCQKEVKPFYIELPLHVKTYDIDFAGIVSNIVYIRWLEDLRLKMLEEYFPLEEQINTGLAPAIVQTCIKYQKAIKIFDKPFGRMWISEMKQVQWKVIGEIYIDGKIASEAEQCGVFVTISNARPVKIPEKVRKIFADNI